MNVNWYQNLCYDVAVLIKRLITHGVDNNLNIYLSYLYHTPKEFIFSLVKYVLICRVVTDDSSPAEFALVICIYI